jgi:hypothetical protein
MIGEDVGGGSKSCQGQTLQTRTLSGNRKGHHHVKGRNAVGGPDNAVAI